MYQFTRQLRLEMTPAERHLWVILRDRTIGTKFRRQHPIGPYVADFVCLARKLIIEVDGGQHMDSERDRQRDAWLAAEGYRVIRFWNNEVLPNRDGVEIVIREALQAPLLSAPSPQPSPPPGRGGSS